jgi:MFS family permease
MNGAVVNRLLWAKGLRAFADGYISLLLPLYLIALGFGPFQVGVIATGTLLGSGALTLLAGFQAWRFPYRSLLLAAAGLMCATGIGFATVTEFWPLLLIAVLGTLNPSSGDVSVFLPLEHAVLSLSAEPDRRTALFARYSLIGSLLAALGALCAGLPQIVATHYSLEIKTALQWMFGLYAAIGLMVALLYFKLPVQTAGSPRSATPLRSARKKVATLAALFSVDSLGGGFVVQSMLALWLFQKFQLSIALAGAIFFWTGVLAAFSALVSVRIARSIGLVNTMVFTHLPANVFLLLTPFMPTVESAVAMLLARSALSSMDVPARTSYVMAIVPPEERAAAAAATAVPRSLATAASPLLAGYLLSISSFGWPLVIAGTLKIAYDLLLLYLFRHVHPPEESA